MMFLDDVFELAERRGEIKAARCYVTSVTNPTKASCVASLLLPLSCCLVTNTISYEPTKASPADARRQACCVRPNMLQPYCSR